MCIGWQRVTSTSDGKEPMDYKSSAESLIGLTFYGRAPVGRQHLKIKPGVTAIYGKNGVGKSRLLQDIEKMLKFLPRSSRNPESRKAERTTVPQPTQAMYMNGFYVREKIDDRLGLDGWATFGSGYRELPRTLERGIKRIGDLLPVGAPPEAAEYLLEHGVFWICDGGTLAYICDPDPMSGPLAKMWDEAQDAWRAGLRQKTPEDDYHDEQAEDAGAPSSGINFPGNWRFDLPTRRTAEHGSQSSALPKLPPLPRTLGLNNWPAWAAAPVAFTGEFDAEIHFYGEGHSDLIKQTVRVLSDNFDTSQPGEVNSGRDRLQVHHKPSMEEAADRLQKSAQVLVTKLFDEPPLLNLSITDPSVWFKGGAAVEWSASSDISRPAVPIDQLGSAHERYSNFAIQRALHRTNHLGGDVSAAESDPQSVLIIDEPERALHPAAEATIAKGLASLADVVIVATHSTEIIDQADNLIHAVDDGGRLCLEPLVLELSPSKRRLSASQLGLTPARLTALTRVLVFVEGQHDKVVIEEFIADELKEARAEVIPMGGTYGINSIAAAGYITAASSAPMVICLDNASNQQFQGLYARLKKATSKQDGDIALNVTRDDESWGTSAEAKRLHAVLTAAWNAGQIDRIRPFGFGERDIARYFKPEHLGLKFDDWDTAYNAYCRKERAGEGIYKGARFKKWAQRNGAAYHTDGLQKLAAQYALPWRADPDGPTTRPQDFTDLANLILDTAKGR